MPSVGGVCPGCKRPLEDHLPSVRRLEGPIPEGKVAVVNGRCQWRDGQQAPQKMCWVALSEPMTAETYRMRLADGAVGLERCPGCGGALVDHGGSPGLWWDRMAPQRRSTCCAGAASTRVVRCAR